MTRNWIPAMLLFLLVSSGRSSPAGETSTRDLIAIIRRHADAAAFEAATRELRRRGPEAGALLDDALDTLTKGARRNWASLSRRIDACAPRLPEGRGAAKLRTAWEGAAAHARAWIFDVEAFPVPTQAVITGPMEGYRQAKERGDEAIRKHERLARLLDKELGRVLRLGPKKARELLDARTAAVASWRRIARAKGTADPLPAVRPLALVLLQLRTGAYAETATLFESEEDPWVRVCLFHAYARAVQGANDVDAKGRSKQASVGLDTLNRYRCALGISPVRRSAKLERMATEHAEEMMRLGYFSHRSPMPDRATKELRARLVGYEGRVVECITGARGPQGAIEFWKYDGGHHRDMVEPRWAEGGFSGRGNMVYDGGSGEPGSVPVLHYVDPGE